MLLACALLSAVSLLRADATVGDAPPGGAAYSTRAEMLEAARREKIASPRGEKRLAIERGLLWIEREKVLERLSVGFHGFHPLFGGLSTGSGFALGARYRRTIPPGGGGVHAAASASFKGYQKYEAGLEIDPAPSLPLTLEFAARYRNYPEEDYFGTGPGSRVEDEADYRLEDTRIEGTVSARLPSGLTVRAGGGYRRVRSAAGTASGVASIEERFAPEEAPGFGRTLRQGMIRAALYLDLRDSPGNPRSGAMFALEQRRFEEREAGPFGHRRTSVEVQGYLPFLHRHRVFALRLRGVDTASGTGDRVPFFDLPTLGGHDTIRGFREFRFRDRKALVANLEYRFEAFIGLDAALFLDAGRVAAAWEAIRLKDFETSWGGGFRFNTARSVILRIDIGHGREGTRAFFKFGHVF